jgi:hypothetical protein
MKLNRREVQRYIYRGSQKRNIMIGNRVPESEWSWSCDRRSVGHSVLVSSSHLEIMTGFFSSVLQLWVSWCWAPLWREDGSVIYSYHCLWAMPEQSLSGPSPAELKTLFYCLIWDSPNLEGQVPVFISPRNRVAQVYPRALGSYDDSQGYGGGIIIRLHTGRNLNVFSRNVKQGNLKHIMRCYSKRWYCIQDVSVYRPRNRN